MKTCWFVLPLLLESRVEGRRRNSPREESDEWIQKHRHLPTLDCPCQDPRECNTISGPPILVGKEIFGFYYPDRDQTDSFNWTHVTSIAWTSDSVICTAHRHGVRAIAAAPSFNLTQMAINRATRVTWAEDALWMVQSRFMDGLTFDYESPLELESAEAQAYVALVQETKRMFHLDNPSLQITVCVAWSPDGIDGRNYPYKELADASDAFYVMDYDTQSQIFNSACLAAANAPYYGMIQGIERYISIGVPSEKLILGVPWYGYRYTCLRGTTNLQDRYCPIQSKPFRGVPCSDAAGSQIGVLNAYQHWRDGEQKSSIHRDENMGACFFNTLERGEIVQYWFDDTVSLRRKFVWAREHSLAGVGPYNFKNAEPLNENDDFSEIRQGLWSAFDAFVSSDTDSVLLGESSSTSTIVAKAY